MLSKTAIKAHLKSFLGGVEAIGANRRNVLDI